MTSPDHRTRQYRVTHIPTGIVTVVQSWGHQGSDGSWGHHYAGAALQAGLRYGLNASVELVPEGQEIALPWGEIPLMLRPRVA